MKCPYCSNEMNIGVVQSARQIFFTDKPHKNFFFPDKGVNSEVLLSTHNWIRPSCVAYHCESCKKIIIDYSVEVE